MKSNGKINCNMQIENNEGSPGSFIFGAGQCIGWSFFGFKNDGWMALKNKPHLQL